MREGVNNHYDDASKSTDYDLSALTIAAHEIKAPLAVLRQLSLEMQHEDTDEETMQKLAYEMQLVAERSLRFASNLTKAESLQRSLFATDPVDPVQICDEVWRELTPLYRASDRTLVYKPHHKKSRLIIANRDLLRRILLNFGDNALHYTDGKGTVELFMELKRSRSLVRLGVRDYGPALPTRVWQDIMQKAPQSVHARPDSSGIGLHIVHQFAEAIGGQVGAIRHRDGASFYVDMPLSKQLTLL